MYKSQQSKYLGECLTPQQGNVVGSFILLFKHNQDLSQTIVAVHDSSLSENTIAAIGVAFFTTMKW